MKSMKTFLLLLFVLWCGSVCGQTISKNLSLADKISYLDLYYPQVPDTVSSDATAIIADVASWKNSSNGKEYALICLHQAGSRSGIAVVDVSDPGNVNHVKTIRISSTPSHNTPHDIKVHGNYAYIAQDHNEHIDAYWVNLQTAVNNPGTTSGTSTSGFGVLPNQARIHNMHINHDHELLFLSNFREGWPDSPGPPVLVFDISGVLRYMSVK